MKLADYINTEHTAETWVIEAKNDDNLALWGYLSKNNQDSFQYDKDKHGDGCDYEIFELMESDCFEVAGYRIEAISVDYTANINFPETSFLQAIYNAELDGRTLI